MSFIYGTYILLLFHTAPNYILEKAQNIPKLSRKSAYALLEINLCCNFTKFKKKLQWKEQQKQTVNNDMVRICRLWYLFSTPSFSNSSNFYSKKRQTLHEGTQWLFTFFMANYCQDKWHKLEFLHLAGDLMGHFLEGFVLLRHWYINPNEKSNKYKSSLLN